MTAPDPYKQACAEACADGCGSLSDETRLRYSTGDKNVPFCHVSPDDGIRCYVERRFACTAPAEREFITQLHAENQRLSQQLAERAMDTERLDWLINSSNRSENAWLSDEFWDSLPGGSEDLLEDARAAMDDAAREGVQPLPDSLEVTAQLRAHSAPLCNRLYADGKFRCAKPRGHELHGSEGGAEWPDSSCKGVEVPGE